MLFNGFNPANAASGGFDYAAWLSAGTSDGAAYNAGFNTTAGDGAGRIVCQIDDNRTLHILPNTSGYPVAQIMTPSGPGAAVVIVSSSVSIIALKEIPNTDRYVLGIGSDSNFYFFDCGASGSTLTVTAKNTEACDAGYAEAAVNNVTDILIDAETHFVVTNQFNDAGTRKFVSALYTLDLATPAMAYVTRDTDADGSSAAFQGAVAFNGSVNGAGVVFGGTAFESTSLRCNKITHTALAVSNTVSSVTLTTAITAASDIRRQSSVLAAINRAIIGYNAGSALIDFASSPAVLSTNAGDSSGSYGAIVDAIGTRVGGSQGTANTTVALTFTRAGGNDLLIKTANLITGETSSTAIGGPTSLSRNGNYVYFSGKQSTNTGRVYVFTKPEL